MPTVIPSCEEKFNGPSQTRKDKALVLEAFDTLFNNRINAIALGVIATEMWDRFAGDELRDQVASIIPVARIGASEEIAAAVLYLCSNYAKFTTGTSLVVDGGFIAIKNERRTNAASKGSRGRSQFRIQ